MQVLQGLHGDVDDVCLFLMFILKRNEDINFTYKNIYSLTSKCI